MESRTRRRSRASHSVTCHMLCTRMEHICSHFSMIFDFIKSNYYLKYSKENKNWHFECTVEAVDSTCWLYGELNAIQRSSSWRGFSAYHLFVSQWHSTDFITVTLAIYVERSHYWVTGRSQSRRISVKVVSQLSRLARSWHPRFHPEEYKRFHPSPQYKAHKPV
jgi:hypothetical protein